MSKARVHSVNVIAQGGVPKLPVAQARIHATGVEGDKQRNLKFHGGPMRAVCLYAIERIRDLRDEGHPIEPGSTGENLTLEGVDWPKVSIGDQFHIGDVHLEVTQFTVPCKQIAGSFCDGDSNRIGQKTRPGWSRVYAKVLKEGIVRVSDDVIWTPAASSLPAESLG